MTRKMTRLSSISSLLLLLIMIVGGGVVNGSKEPNKYSKEANTVNYKEVKNPFRMSKVNSVWHKAQHRLSDTKLRSLYTDLASHDKEEAKLKRLISDGLDKEGLEEAKIRQKFRNILSTYGLLEHFVEGQGIKPDKLHNHDPSSSQNDVINKGLFKDKKLAKLWDKAERAGFDEKELKVLKEEFFHHQDKIEEYYAVLEKKEQDKPQNFLDPLSSQEHEAHLDKSFQPSKKYPDGGLASGNEIKDKHREIKDHYDSLHRKVAYGPNSRDFAEPRVSRLWKLAREADFTDKELDSLHQELKHYEKRLEKLHYFQSEHLAKKLNSPDPSKEFHHHEKDTLSFYEDKIKKHERQVDKLHLDLETKILNRHHNEL